MYIGRLKLGSHRFKFVFRHRFEHLYAVDKAAKKLDGITMWNRNELGLFFKREQAVGVKNFKTPSEWKNNLVYSYMFGISLVVCRMWITYDKGAMTLGEKLPTKNKLGNKNTDKSSKDTSESIT